MSKANTGKTGFTEWERSFRAAAKNDKCRILRAHLKQLELPEKPALLLEGTILFVQACIAYLMLDNRPFDEFLTQQQYDPASVTGAPYLATFDICDKAFARITVPASLGSVDLADLYGMPWDAYRVVGYRDIWISRVDGEGLSDDEMDSFEKVVTDDLRFDYGEDELNFWFDPDTHDGILKVTVQDVYEYDDDDEDQSIETVEDDSSRADGNQRQRRSKD